MSSLATSLDFDDYMMWINLADGRRVGVPLAWFPRLLRASADALRCYEISGGGVGLHWDALDEDISVAGLLAGQGDLTQPLRRAA